ncbi:MAG: bifunctional DNA primase/polymerase [Anaerolineae bacterium]|nr:bifunctional DNA primase/polymerase [Anaerolineae bacterium]
MAVLSIQSTYQHLLRVAVSYSHLDYSVIPVFGNHQPARGKLPAVNWKPFQARKARESDFRRWFREDGFAGLGIVTGAISGLIVLDFDEQSLADEFVSRFPYLTETKIVQSAGRKLPHYYYHIPEYANVNSRRVKGIDLLSDGRYVVAPPTAIGDGIYKIVRDKQPKTLTTAHIRLIEAFLDEQSHYTHETSEKAKNTPISIISEKTTREKTPLVPIMPQDAIALYCHLAPEIGRNEALFNVSLKMRDTGWLLEDAIKCLKGIHINQVAASSHVRETANQRSAEAIATIKSAFSRPPRKQMQSADTPQTLPTMLREVLLQRKMGYLVRVLDGLLLSGVTQSSEITEKSIVNTLSGIVGRYSILKALSTLYDDNAPIFARSNPSPRTPTPTHVALANATNPNNKCVLFSATISDGIQRGRPPKTYRMPDIDTLCIRFGVKFRYSDPLALDDLRSTKTYRQAMQREFIKRRPGLYPMNWLANRLGIVRRTLQRYRPDMPIRQKAMFRRVDITWDTLNRVPDKVEVFGAFLQDDTGKKYPAKLEIAKFLLRRKRTVEYVRQDVNYYWHLDRPPSPLVMMGIHPQSPKTSLKARFEDMPTVQREKMRQIPQIAVKPDSENTSRQANSTGNTSLPIQAVPARASPIQYKPKAKRYYRKPLADEVLESAAQRLYKRSRAMCETKEGYMSMATARRLAEQYGTSEVKRLIQLFAWRDNIENPAGFAVVWLRSESKREQLNALYPVQ